MKANRARYFIRMYGDINGTSKARACAAVLTEKEGEEVTVQLVEELIDRLGTPDLLHFFRHMLEVDDAERTTETRPRTG